MRALLVVTYLVSALRGLQLGSLSRRFISRIAVSASAGESKNQISVWKDSHGR